MSIKLGNRYYMTWCTLSFHMQCVHNEQALKEKKPAILLSQVGWGSIKGLLASLPVPIKIHYSVCAIRSVRFS